MSNIYGVEVSNWAPIEVVDVECPYCRGISTELIGFEDEAHNTEIYVCHECEVDFTVDVEIPF